MMKNLLNISILILLFAVTLSFGQEKIPVKISGKSEKLQVKSGEKFTISMLMDIPKGYYTYSLEEQIGPEGIGPLATFISIEPEESIEISGKIKTLDEKEKFDKGFKMQVKYYDGKARFEFPVKAKKSIDFSKDIIRIVVNMQICQGTSCYPPEDFAGFVTYEQTTVSGTKDTISDKEVIAEMIQEIDEMEDSETNRISTNEQSIENVNNGAVTGEEISDQSKAKKSIWSTIIVGLLAGLFSLTTPCVYPMVPITVSFFTKRAEQAKGKGLRDALAYAIGIILTFTLLGFLVSLIFGPDAIQQLSTSPGVNIFITAIFVIFALSLFGMFELQLPTGLMNKLNMKSQQGSGISSVILMGLTFSLASFSCTGPIVGAALIEASSGGWIHPIISMLSFSTMLAAPFFLLALFPKAMSGMPKAGGWMNNIKVVLAFILIAVSLKFFNMALESWGIGMPRDLFLAIWVSSSLLITVYLLGVFRMSHDTPLEKINASRMLIIIAFGAVTFYLFTGFLGRNLGVFESFLPAPDQSAMTVNSNTASVEKDIWYENYDEAIEKAKMENKNIFIDFTGKYCTNCKLMERSIFPKPKVAEQLSKVIKLKLITDIREEPYISNKNFQKEKFKTVAIPMYALIRPSGEVIAIDHFNDNEDKFADFLKKATK